MNIYKENNNGKYRLEYCFLRFYQILLNFRISQIILMLLQLVMNGLQNILINVFKLWQFYKNNQKTYKMNL